MNVDLSAEAQAQVLYIDAWWRQERRAAADLFENELEATFDRLQQAPRLGVVYKQGDVDEVVYRLLMPRTRHHVYYVLRANSVFVLSVWGAVKEHGPQL